MYEEPDAFTHAPCSFSPSLPTRPKATDGARSPSCPPAPPPHPALPPQLSPTSTPASPPLPPPTATSPASTTSSLKNTLEALSVTPRRPAQAELVRLRDFEQVRRRERARREEGGVGSLKRLAGGKAEKEKSSAGSGK